MKSPVFTKDEDDEFVRRYLAGESCKDLAYERGQGYHSALDLLKKRDVKLRQGTKGGRQRKVFTPEQDEDLIQRYIAGEWLSSLARERKQSDDAVRFLLKSRGVLRGMGEQRRGPDHPRWTEGHFVDTKGYVRIKVADDDDIGWALCSEKQKGYVLEHRLVMAHHIDRPLFPTEHVHHKNGVKNDNRLENLELWTKSHPAGQRVEDKKLWAIEFLREYAPEVLK